MHRLALVLSLLLLALLAPPAAAEVDVRTASIADLQQALASGETTSVQLVRAYRDRILTYDVGPPSLNSVRTLDDGAIATARRLDRERRRRGVRGPLHGVPVLLKDNIDVAGQPTPAGSLALASSFPPGDAFLVARLRAAGAVVLGKTNLTEFANFMTIGMPSGYSSLGGQVLNAYDLSQTASGSSTGAGVAVTMRFAAAGVGTETSGSILSPARASSVVGIKPTVGLVSRTGVLPIAASQDTAGPFGRSVADAATLLGGMTGVDEEDPATAGSAGRFPTDPRELLRADGLEGARLGVARQYLTGLGAEDRAVFNRAVDVLRDRGATVEEVDIPSYDELRTTSSSVLTYEFKHDLNAYLARLGPDAPRKTLADIIAFNREHPAETLKFGQVLLEEAEATSGTLTEPEYLADRARDLRLSREQGIDAALAASDLDALVFPNSTGAGIGARAGYPSVIVPAGYTPTGRRPVGITFLGDAYAEPRLVTFAYAYEQGSQARRDPEEINPSAFRPRATVPR